MNIETMDPQKRAPREPLHPLGFDQLRRANLRRCGNSFHPIEAWSPTDWACALAGEVGEAANLIKKGRRGEPVSVVAIATELADAVIYLDLLACRLGIDLGGAIASKFNVVSQRRGSAERLEPRPKDPGCASNLIYQHPGGALEDSPTTGSPEGPQ